MKLRMIITALCLCLGMCAMAQGHGNRGNRGNRGGQQEGARNMDMVVDTAIINSMDLEPELVASVLQLQAQKQEELKATLIKMAQQNQGGQGGFNPEAIAAMREQMEDFKSEYRMALRKLLGAANYITYLEKVIDKRPAMGPGMGNGNPRRMQGGGNWGGGQMQGGFGGGQNGGWGGQNGGFGGGEGFGGGFGGGEGFGE